VLTMAIPDKVCSRIDYYITGWCGACMSTFLRGAWETFTVIHGQRGCGL